MEKNVVKEESKILLEKRRVDISLKFKDGKKSLQKKSNCQKKLIQRRVNMKFSQQRQKLLSKKEMVQVGQV